MKISETITNLIHNLFIYNTIFFSEYNKLLKSKNENILMIDTVKTNFEIIHMHPIWNSKYENKTGIYIK